MYEKREIWIRTAFVAVLYAAAIYAVDRVLPAEVGNRGLRIALAFACVQTATIVILLVVLLTRRGIAARRTRRSHAIGAEAHAAVAEHAAGHDRLRVLRALQSESKRDVAAAVLSFIAATRGSMQGRVSALARDLGIEQRNLLEQAAAKSLYERVLLADALRPQADHVAATEIPRVLREGNEQQILTALDLLRAWRRALRVEGLEHALKHPAAEVRSRAFAVLPYVVPSDVSFLPAGLTDASPQVRTSAAESAARLRVFVPELERALHDDHGAVAVAAAFALASSAEGLAVLQRSTDAVAFEALEKATIGRLA
ncbi:MAG TPA: hypothetical protein VEK11_05245 [Thermoanaerobaculia bacterium]|nr:hypothetical protein [Thermoanaerobaculia bacterium]